MWDEEAHSNKLKYFLSEKLLIEDQRSAAFWSHPAWFCETERSSLSTAAAREWIAYNRLAVALKKESVAQIIGRVQEVIPNSKLAKYGNYSYEIDCEDMFFLTEDINFKCRILKTDKAAYARRYDFWASESSETETNILDPKFKDLGPKTNRNDATGLDDSVKILSEWLNVLRHVLINLRQIANEEQLLDTWEDTLLKFCLRFVCIARENENIAKLLNSEITFITDYEQLQKMPISKMELQSIPQPENNSNIYLDRKSVDALWLKLSSSEIRRLWKNDTSDSSRLRNEYQCDDQLAPLIKTNFLRNYSSKRVDISRHTIDIPKDMEEELLGSLLHVINATSIQTSVNVDAASRNYFPTAQREWNKQLYPQSSNLNPTLEKEFITRKLWNKSITTDISESVHKLEHGFSETSVMPSEFYKLVPPPAIPTSLPPVHVPFMQYQPRNRFILMPNNNLASNSSNQAMQYKVPAASVSGVSSSAYMSLALLSPNYNVPQRLSVPNHPSASVQFQRMNVSRVSYQYCNPYDNNELQKFQLKTGLNSFSEMISIESKIKEVNQAVHVLNNTENGALNNIPVPSAASFVHFSHGYNLPFRVQQNIGNTNSNANSTPLPIISKSQMQVRESRLPVKMNYPITSYRLRTPLIKNTPPPRNHYFVPQHISKPRFLGAITVNNIKRVQEKLFLQRHQRDFVNSVHDQDNQHNNTSLNLTDTGIGYEDKVEKWLESVSRYVKSGSYINLEELPELSSFEQSDDNKSSDGAVGDCSDDPWKRQNSAISELLQPGSANCETKLHVQIRNSIYENIYESKQSILRHKKFKAKRLPIKHLRFLSNITTKLKNCKNLKKKIEILRKYFAGTTLTSSERVQFEKLIKIRRIKCDFLKKNENPKKRLKPASRQKFDIGINLDQKQFSTQNLDMKQSNWLIDDYSNYKMLIRENLNFNAFPSKRMKISQSVAFFKKETLIKNERDQKVSNLNYFESVIDRLFFDTTGFEGINEGRQDNQADAKINGWSYFKAAVKTVIKNIISSMNAQIPEKL